MITWFFHGTSSVWHLQPRETFHRVPRVSGLIKKAEAGWPHLGCHIVSLQS